jgi:UDP-glucose 4-epimerase
MPYVIVRFATVLTAEESLGFFRYETIKRILAKGKAGPGTNIWHLFRGHPDMVDTLSKLVPAERNPAVAVYGPTGEPWTVHVADVRDIVDGVMLAHSHTSAHGQVFNIAGPQATSYEDGAKAIARTLDVPMHSIRMPVDWRLEMDISKARTVLGFEPRWTFEESLRSALAYAQQTP